MHARLHREPKCMRQPVGASLHVVCCILPIPGQPNITRGFSLKLMPKDVVLSFLFLCYPVSILH